MRLRVVAIVCGVAVLALGVSSPLRIKHPIFSGIAYPAEAAHLRAAVEQYIAEVRVVDLPGAVTGCIMPFGTFPASGLIAAHSVKPLVKGQYDRVIVLAPAVHARLEGCSIPGVQLYRTPLGDVPLDGVAIRRMTLSPLVEIHAVIYRRRGFVDPRVNRRALHEQEYAIEMVLPFLQHQLGPFKLIPIVVGDLSGEHGGSNAVELLVDAIRPFVDRRTLVVACADFTRYGDYHNYMPFRDNVLESIAALDQEAFKLVERRDIKGFQRYVSRTGNLRLGRAPIEMLMRLLSPDCKGLLLDYAISGQRNENFDRSITYASVVYFDPTRPAPASLQDLERPNEGGAATGLASEP